MSAPPYIPLYVDDYDAHTAHLTPAQDGIYGRLLRLTWRTPGCSLPNDPAWIARMVRLSKGDWDRIGKPVLEEFFRLSRGRFIQKRLKAEYDDISRKKSARVEAGKKGGAAKAQKTKSKSASNATVLPGDTRAFPEPEPEPDKKKDLGLLPLETIDRPVNGVAVLPKGSRLRADWHPQAEQVAYAVTQGFDTPQTDRMAEDFRDYWTAQPGQKGVKLDWPATWRRWVRTQAERRPSDRTAKRVGFV